MAEAGGFYAREGLKVDIVSMEGGSRGVQVLLSGEIQAMHVGVAPVIQANRAGADIRAITRTRQVLRDGRVVATAGWVRATPSAVPGHELRRLAQGE